MKLTEANGTVMVNNHEQSVGLSMTILKNKMELLKSTSVFTFEEGERLAREVEKAANYLASHLHDLINEDLVRGKVNK